jgi:tryptophan halogenase
MTQQINNIVIVGGGSAGWMTAASLVTQFPDKKITVIESPNIPSIGVGESTVGGLRNWLKMIGIKDEDFIAETDATYKLAIKFNNFHNLGSNTWYYPFGDPYIKENTHNRDDWFLKKALYPNTTTHDYVDSYYPQMALVNSNKLTDDSLDNFNLSKDSAFHFDAVKFGLWLRDKFCKPKGVEYIADEVVNVLQDENGISTLVLESSKTISADLFVDCTGFSSLLIGKALNTPFKDYSHILTNNRAWAVQLAYTDKERQLNAVTECSALDNGWVWHTPLWSRIGSGYVYSDKYITPEQAKEDFIKHLSGKGFDTTNSTFRDLKMRVGIHEKLWVKNVVAIGLSAAFLEPLESTGLLTVHDFATNLCRTLSRGSISQWDRDEFNLKCHDEFNYWSQFVVMHYALSSRSDSQYWRDIAGKSHIEHFQELNQLQTQSLYHQSIYAKGFKRALQEDNGVQCLAAGMNWNPLDLPILRNQFSLETNLKEKFDLVVNGLHQRKQRWKRAVETAPSCYQYLKDNFY